MKTIKGDLISLASSGEFSAIIHGCNTRGVMGAGIARQIAQRWPEAEKADKLFCVKNKQHIEDSFGKQALYTSALD